MTRLSYDKIVCVGFVLWAVTAVRLSAQTFTTLATFSDGSTIFSPLVQGTDGNLYGTANDGGTQASGSVFQITQGGILTTLHSFCSQPICSDGSAPAGALVVGPDGNLYGTTSFGGTGSACAGGCGTAFKITPSGRFQVIHDFNISDGASPYAGLVLGSDGNFYGTTSSGGGGSSCSDGGCGTVFKMSADGIVTNLHGFDEDDGAFPLAALIQGTDSKFYGTTSEGGASMVPAVTVAVVRPSRSPPLEGSRCCTLSTTPAAADHWRH